MEKLVNMYNDGAGGADVIFLFVHKQLFDLRNFCFPPRILNRVA